VSTRPRRLRPVPITFSVSSQSAERASADLLALGVFAAPSSGKASSGKPSSGKSRSGKAAASLEGPGVDALDAALDGRLAAFVEEARFTGKPGETLAVPTNGRLGAKAALLVGLGPRDDVTPAGLRRAAATLARRADQATSVATTLTAAAPDADPVAVTQAVAEGIALGAYQYLAYKSDGTPTQLRRVTLLGPGGAAVRDALARARVVTDAVAWARDMVNTPSGAKSPAEFAAAARKLLTGKGVTVTVLTEAQIRAQRMGGVIGVGQGSDRPPRFVKVVYNPPGGRARGTLALVGKGVVFDSGGISIKPSAGMEEMKTDMSGAAAALATMATLRALGVRHRVVSYTPMVENMPSGGAIRPGDVLRMRDGTTVEVLNTDAEGRLILADALALAVEDGADAIVDLATLTGACVVALGNKVAGVMGNDDEWVAQVRDAADRAGEPVWPLPLPPEYRKLLDSEIADLANISSGRYGGAITAGLFLESFVGEVAWVHMDIAGPARAPADDGELTQGGTGFGVRTLAELVRTFEVPKKPSSKARSASKRSRPKRAPAKKARKSA